MIFIGYEGFCGVTIARAHTLIYIMHTHAHNANIFCAGGVHSAHESIRAPVLRVMNPYGWQNTQYNSIRARIIRAHNGKGIHFLREGPLPPSRGEYQSNTRCNKRAHKIKAFDSRAGGVHSAREYFYAKVTNTSFAGGIHTRASSA